MSTEVNDRKSQERHLRSQAKITVQWIAYVMFFAPWSLLLSKGYADIYTNPPKDPLRQTYVTVQAGEYTVTAKRTKLLIE